MSQKEDRLDKEEEDISVDVLVLSGMPRAKAERQRYLNSFQGRMYLKSKYGDDYHLSPESRNAQMDMYVVKVNHRALQECKDFAMIMVSVGDPKIINSA